MPGTKIVNVGIFCFRDRKAGVFLYTGDFSICTVEMLFKGRKF